MVKCLRLCTPQGRGAGESVYGRISCGGSTVKCLRLCETRGSGASWSVRGGPRSRLGGQKMFSGIPQFVAICFCQIISVYFCIVLVLMRSTYYFLCVLSWGGHLPGCIWLGFGRRKTTIIAALRSSLEEHVSCPLAGSFGCFRF